MNELQQRLCDILFWFHDFCEKEQLTYYMCYGTFLGAVRHSGFIPWDDDIDICMPRNDYEKCKSIFEKVNNQIDYYYLESPYMDAKDYLYTYNKLYDIRTTMIESTRVNCRRGVFLDIFPLDGAGNTLDDGIKYYKRINCYKNLLKTRTWTLNSNNSIIINFAIIAGRMIPSCIFDDKKIAKKIDSIAKKRNYNEFNYVGCLLGPYNNKEVIKRSIFGNPKPYNFEGKCLYGPEQYDEYLTNIYGDWKRIPNDDKKNTEHNFLFIDLNHSFLGK